MDRFTAKGALLTGLDVIRRRPLLILIWAGLFLAADLVLAGAFQAWRGSGAERPSYAVLRMGLAYSTGAIVGTMVVQVVAWTSAFRAFMRPKERAALGREDLAAMVSSFVVQLIAALGSAAVTIFLTQSLIQAGMPLAIATATRAPITALNAVGLYWAALACAWGLARGEIAPLRCWTIIQGHFWKATGVVAGVAAIAYLLRAGIRALVGILNHHAPLPPMTLHAVAEPPFVFTALAGSAVTALQMALVAGVIVTAYRSRWEPGDAHLAAVAPELG